MAQADASSFVLGRKTFSEKEREIARFGDLTAYGFRYSTGVEAIRLRSQRGEAVVLPFMGQMIWSARFDGVELAMLSMFEAPRPVATIVETYGCLAFHSGLLRNGVPGPDDKHALHGEAPCAAMDAAGLVCGRDERGRYMAITGEHEYAMGFGAHYLSQPCVTLHEDETVLDMAMQVANLSAAPMDLMYMCHVNFAFAEGARLVQPLPFTPAHVMARTSIPGHVTPTEEWRSMLADVAAHPARLQYLREPALYDPEFVFYLKGARVAGDGRVCYALLRPEGDAFAMRWNPETMPHTVRWILVNSDQSVAAFAMPATCEPEGYSAEKRKGHVRTLQGGKSARFETEIAYIPRERAAVIAAEIEEAALMSAARKPRIAVVGSNMVDLVTYVNRMPVKGETVEAPRFEMGHGGKGANQAVAAAKLGAEVVMVTAVGDDLFGDNTIKNLAALGVDTTFIKCVPGKASGVAPIMVEPNGENSILIVKGANADLTPEDVERAGEALKSCDLILLQLEVPLETIYSAIRFGKKHGVKTVLNPAPATPELDIAHVRDVSYFVPNETELAILTRMPTETDADVEAAAKHLLTQGVQAVVVTLGGRGALLATADGFERIAATRVTPVDTTGAGDAFVGAFARYHAAGASLKAALDRAARYAANSVRRNGTQKAYSSEAEFEAFERTLPSMP